MTREMHPKMKEQAQRTKEAWAHLKAHDPEFNKLPTKERFRAVAAHVKKWTADAKDPKWAQ